MAKAHTFVDNFNDNITDVLKWTVNGTPAPQNERIREVNGRVEINLPLSGGNGSYISAGLWDLDDSEIRLEVVQVASGAGNTFMFVRNDPGTGVGFYFQGGMVKAIEQAAGPTFPSVAEVPYDPAQHRWIRLRHHSAGALGETLYWELSANGTDWTLLAARPNTLTAGDVRISFGLSSSSGGVTSYAIFDNFNVQDATRARRVEERRLSARDVRVQAAEVAAARRHAEHMNNNDEVNYPQRILAGNFSKGLKHDALGDPDPGSYASLLRALESRDPQDFEEIILGTLSEGAKRLKLTNPQSGLAFDIAGPDAQEQTLPPAPRFDSEVAAHEAGELYWMAVSRDVHFADYGTSGDVAAAISSLNSEFPRFGGTTPVTAQNVFRGIFPGDQVGPYVSQFLLKGNTDPRKANGLGQDANEGFISYGSRTIDQRLFTAQAGVDHLTTFADWLDVQNGLDRRGMDSIDLTTRRFIRNLRDGTTFVHFDQVLDAYYNTAWILMSEPTGNQLFLQAGVTGRPQIDLEFPKDQGNPYDPPGTAMDSRTQVGFNTFGPTHLLQTLAEVLGRALRAVWFQKWFVHRRLRPEEYGGRVHNQAVFLDTGGAQGRSYGVHTSIVTSLQTGLLAPYFGQVGERFPNSYLLPQAYPEGAPTHPAYGAGHATGSGAMVTILKAFFDESTPIENPLMANAAGSALVAYTGADAGQMTVGGELNKLASNIALFRNAAGVHWRSDYTESLPFGESIAIGLLQEMSLGFNEDDAFFELTRFDGQKIRIFDGKVEPVVV